MNNINIPPQNNNETINITKQPINNENQNKNTEEHNANILAGISLACIICSRIMFIMSIIINSIITNNEKIIQAALDLFSGLAGTISLAGLVAMIVTRIKYPKNKLGKAAMWTYIIITALEFLAVIIFTVACIAAGIALIEACSNCPG